MPFIPTPNTLQAELRYLFDNQQVENTLYFEYIDGVDLAGAVALADYLFDWWDTNFKPLMATTIALREIYITDLTSISSFSHTRVSSPIVPGTRAGPAMPNSVALCIKFNTAQRGRSFRGRNYVMGMVEGDVTANNFDGAYVTAVQAAYVAMNAGLSDLGADWVVVSRFTNNAPRVTGVTTPITTVGVTDGIVDSQRRRLPGRGT